MPAVDALEVRPGGVYVDCTFGGGGHSREILVRLGQSDGGEAAAGRLLAFDQDRDALERARAMEEFAGDTRLTLVLGNFRYLSNFLRYYGVEAGGVDGILADLGVSFHHFDDPERGFSFRYEGPLDMRMNRQGLRTAADVIADSSEAELAEMLRLYGELPQAKRVAQAIVKARTQAPLTTIDQLLAVVTPLLNPRQQKKELAQVFQALRIVVNGEIDALRSLLTQSLRALRPGGRLAVITYHSLEDRLVKNFMRTGNVEGREEKDFFGRRLSQMTLLTSKPIVPDAQEVERNPRSRSAKLRIGEKSEE